MKTSLICLFVAIGLASATSPIVVDQTDAIAESIMPVLIGPMLHSIDEFLHLFIAIQPPVPIGRAEGINVFQFLYDNVVSTFLSDITSNTANYLQNSLNNLLNKPFGIGKRDVQGDLVARVDFLSFIYDNILQDLFSGIVTNAFGHLTSTLTGLIQTNPLGVGKRAEGVNVFQFLYDNVIADLFGSLASNTANYLQNSLNNLLNKPFGIGKRSISVETILNLFAPLSTTLIEKVKNLVRQALSVWTEDRMKFIQLIQTALNEIKTSVAQVAQQLSPLVPAALLAQVSQILAGLQSMLVYWTSGLAGSLGPVLLPH